MYYWFSVHVIAELAADMEAKGIAFYRRLQEAASNTTISDMCAFFAGQEQ